MSCYQPLKGFIIGLTKNGKPEYKITPYTCDHVYQDKQGNWQKAFDAFHSQAEADWISDFVEIPCGKCIGCRLAYAEQWAARCMLELQYHKSAYFLTLTYDDEHLPRCSGVHPVTGEILEGHTLVKEDFQKFMKRLRKNTGQKLRYYMCGEYGSTTFRPHYHAIVFGLELDDLVLYKRSKLGDNYYNSDFLNATWQKGYVVVGECTWQSVSYTARYVMKKAHEDLSLMYASYGMLPEYTAMSTRPGIAYEYYNSHPDLFDFEHINIGSAAQARQVAIPRYFRRRLEHDNPDRFLDRRIARSFVDDAASVAKKQILEAGTSLEYIEYLEQLEDIKKRQIKSLKREL